MSTTEVTPPKPLTATKPVRSAEWVNSRYLGLTLTLLFLTAAGVQNAIVLTWINVTGGNLSQPGNIYGLALVFAQQGLVALHCGFSRQHIALRTALFLATVLVSGDLASRYDDYYGHMQGTWMLALLAHGLFVLVSVWWMRVSGCRLVQDGEQPTDHPIRWQFNLLRLFGVTTLAAIVLGVFSRFRINTDLLPDMVFEATMLALLPLQVCCYVLWEKRFSTMVIAGFVTVCTLGFLLGHVPGNDVLSMLWRAFVQSLMLHAALSIVQQAGYRIVEREIKK